MDPLTILCCGNSHTAGFPGYDPLMGGDPHSSYQFWLEKELRVIQPEKEFRIVNQGMCGDTSQGIVWRLFQELEATHYDLVILAGGTNDLGMRSEVQIFENLKEGYDTCKAHDTLLISPSIPPINIAHLHTCVNAVNNDIRKYTAGFSGVYFADWFGTLKDENGFLEDRFDAGDGVHLSVEGYKQIGELLASVVSKALSF